MKSLLTLDLIRELTGVQPLSPEYFGKVSSEGLARISEEIFKERLKVLHRKMAGKKYE